MQTQGTLHGLPCPLPLDCAPSRSCPEHMTAASAVPADVIAVQFRSFMGSAYECSSEGVIRNRYTRKAVKVQRMPRAGDRHAYVKLVMQRGGHQRTVAVRNVVAACWCDEDGMLCLDEEGRVWGEVRVFHLDRDPHNNRADNLVVMHEREGMDRGLALQPCSVRPLLRGADVEGVAEAGGAAEADGEGLSEAEGVAAAPGRDERPAAEAAGRGMQHGQSMTWPTGYDSQGRRL